MWHCFCFYSKRTDVSEGLAVFYMKVFFTMTMAAGFYETSIFLQLYIQAHSNSLVIIMKTSDLTWYSLLINLKCYTDIILSDN
jgi:hypothetical protein